MSRSFLWLVALSFLAACERSPKAGASVASSASSSSSAQASERYQAMSPGQRKRAAAEACYVGPACRAADVHALLGAAQSDYERDALRAAGRPAFANQYAAARRAKGEAIEVSMAGDKGTTLRVGGKCTRFLLENFLGGSEKKVAKALGFSRIECDSTALKASADF